VKMRVLPAGAVNLGRLIELAERIGICVRKVTAEEHEYVQSSGVCSMRGRIVAVLDERSTEHEQARALIEALRRSNMDDCYIPPAVRDAMDEKYISKEENHERCI
jgi:hypothetical protein